MAKKVEVRIIYGARRRSTQGQPHFYLFHNKHVEFEFQASVGASKVYCRHGFDQRDPDAEPTFHDPTDQSEYVCEDVPEAAFDALKGMSARSAGTVPFRIRVWRYRYFSEVLHYVGRPKDDGHNLGWPHPDDAARIKAAAMDCPVTYYSGRRDGRRTYVTFKDVPYQVYELNESGDTLEITLILEAAEEVEVERTQAEIDANKPAQKRILALELGGADWSDLSEGEKKLEGPQAHQMGNVMRLAWNYTKPGEGLKVVEKAVEQVVTAAREGKITSMHAYSLACRNAGDQRLILANYVESNQEEYQKPLSQIFKSAHSNMWWASPVNFIRSLSDPGDRTWMGPEDLPPGRISGDDYLDLIAQIGAGHCGEHSYMTFGILQRAAAQILEMEEGGERLVDKHDMDHMRYMIRSGYYKEDNSNNDADHAFSVIGFEVNDQVAKQVPYTVSGGQTFDVWVVDLEKAVELSGKSAYMVDAWVDGPVKDDKALLSRISSFDTTCVMLSDYHHIPAPATVQ